MWRAAVANIGVLSEGQASELTSFIDQLITSGRGGTNKETRPCLHLLLGILKGGYASVHQDLFLVTTQSYVRNVDTSDRIDEDLVTAILELAKVRALRFSCSYSRLP